MPLKFLCALSAAFTIELHLSGLIGMVRHPDVQKIRIIGFFIENRLYWQFEAGKKIIQKAVLGYILQGGSNMTGTDLCVNKPHCAAAVRP